jgi:hypothetical protein
MRTTWPCSQDSSVAVRDSDVVGIDMVVVFKMTFMEESRSVLSHNATTQGDITD